MEKCVACQYYERSEATQGESRAVGWGKCRRNVPVVHPVSAKAYMVEGIWPHVRDDDWCGEWTAAKRRDAALPDARNLMLQPPIQSPGRAGSLPPGSLMTPASRTSPAALTPPVVSASDSRTPLSGVLASD